MLHPVNSLLGITIRARDGDAGQVEDLYCDDQAWAVRYVIARVSTDSGERRVLLEPEGLGWLSDDGTVLPVTLTASQVAQAPDAARMKPVSAQARPGHRPVWHWPPYTTAGALTAPVAPGLQPGAAAAAEGAQKWTPLPSQVQSDRQHDPHLRSIRELCGYVVRGACAEGARLEDVLLDDRSWTVRFLIARQADAPADETVRIPPDAVMRIDCGAKVLSLRDGFDAPGASRGP